MIADYATRFLSLLTQLLKRVSAARLLLFISAYLLGRHQSRRILSSALNHRQALALRLDESESRNAELEGLLRSERASTNAAIVAQQQLTKELQDIQVKLLAANQELSGLKEEAEADEQVRQQLQQKIDRSEELVRQLKIQLEEAVQEASMRRSEILGWKAAEQGWQNTVAQKEKSIEELRGAVKKARKVQQVYAYSLAKCAPDLARRLLEMEAEDLQTIDALLVAVPSTAAPSAYPVPRTSSMVSS